MATVRKRSWGKSRQKERQAITVIDQMEIDTEPFKVTDVTLRGLASPDDSEGVDLQQPELLSSEALVRVLAERKVPIPVYPDGKPSRERLVYLFRRHVTPRPQRRGAGYGRGQRRAISMEVEDRDRPASWDEWARGGASSELGLVKSRKRKLNDADTSLAKRPVDISCINSLSKITVSDSLPVNISSGVAASRNADLTKPSPSRIIKIKRPGKVHV